VNLSDTLSQNCINKKVLQRLGEDLAYTFKGLYKTSDWLEWEYKILLLFPILLGLISLGLDCYIPPLYLKIFSIWCIYSTVHILANQKSYEKISGYRKLADEFKKLYDEVEFKYYCSDFSNLDELKRKKDELMNKISEYPISKVGRHWSRWKIKKEMNLNWIYEN